jgi:hypothetical protein
MPMLTAGQKSNDLARALVLLAATAGLYFIWFGSRQTDDGIRTPEA